MNLPTIEPIPDKNEKDLPPARRRQQRRRLVPPGSSERADFLHDLAYRTEPSFDFFIFSLLCGIALGAALLLDSPGLAVLAALLAPYMAPVIGVSLGTITGALPFVLQSLGSLGIGSLIVFLCGAVAGGVVEMLPARIYQQALYHSHFTWPDFFVLALGAALASYLLVRSPKRRPLVASVAIAYSLYLPIGTAGFGITSGLPGLWPGGLWLFVINLVWAVVVGTVVLALLGLRPLNATGYLLGAVYTLVGAALLLVLYQPLAAPPPPAATTAPTATLAGAAIPQPVASATPTPYASPTQTVATRTPTPTVTLTPSLVPTSTPSLTITPQPTPVWARVNAVGSDGALLRSQPGYTASVVQSLLNGTLVQILPDTETAEGVTWVHVRTTNDKEGWIVQTLVRTATPSP
jgi:hypothetical protein